MKYIVNKYLSIAFVLLFTLVSINSQAQKKNRINRDICDYSKVHLRNGAKYFGTELTERNSPFVKLRLSTGDTIQFAKTEVRKFLRSKEDILVRNDHKYVNTNYLGLDVRRIFTGLGSVHLIESSIFFLNDFRWSLFIGGYSEVFDFGGFGIGGTSLRYYVPNRRKYRPYLSVLYFYSSTDGDENFNNQTLERLDYINIGGGYDVFSRKNIKFDIGGGLNLRYRKSSQIATDQLGNPVLFEKNTLGVSLYLEVGVKFRIAKFH